MFRGFHVRKDVAPLKLWLPIPIRALESRFHVRKDVAPLKPLSMRATSQTCPCFHVRKDVAPLKLSLPIPIRALVSRFHVRKDVAPLKPLSMRAKSQTCPCFHVRKDVAPLKHVRREGIKPPWRMFPRSKGRGSIEALSNTSLTPD